MTKIVYNACFGGFNISHDAVMRYAEIKGITMWTRQDGLSITHYYLCPPEEYERINAEESANPVHPDRYVRSNALYFSTHDLDRTDPVLVQVVEELGEKANGFCADLRIAELPTGTLYRIDEYDGNESVLSQAMYEWKIA